MVSCVVTGLWSYTIVKLNYEKLSKKMEIFLKQHIKHIRRSKIALGKVRFP